MFCSVVVNVRLSSKLIPLALTPWALLEIWKAWIGGCIAVVALSTDWMGGTITILLPPIQILSDQQECLGSGVFKGPFGIQHPSALQDKSSCDMASFKWTVGRQSTLLSCTLGFYFVDVLGGDDQISWAVAALSQRERFECIRLSCVVFLETVDFNHSHLL